VTLKLGGWEFDNWEYDAAADVLYLSIGEPRAGVGEETPEGHVWRFDETGRFCGLTLIGIRELMDHSDVVNLTLPSPVEIRSEDLEPALC
jgi:uncharacterized protein YuzE